MCIEFQIPIIYNVTQKGTFPFSVFVTRKTGILTEREEVK